MWRISRVLFRDVRRGDLRASTPAFLDAATVEALLDLARAGDAEILDRLWEVRGTLSEKVAADGRLDLEVAAARY
jgi:hypothetical protein